MFVGVNGCQEKEDEAKGVESNRECDPGPAYDDECLLRPDRTKGRGEMSVIDIDMEVRVRE